MPAQHNKGQFDVLSWECECCMCMVAIPLNTHYNEKFRASCRRQRAKSYWNVELNYNKIDENTKRTGKKKQVENITGVGSNGTGNVIQPAQ